ncbi:MAG: zinc ribbon domain-containing protein [Gaiellaceae bacterium]
MKTCPNCGQATRDDDRFCPSCGQPTDPRRQPARPPADDRARRTVAAASTNAAVYVQALRRFWWVLVIGLVVALLAALSARFSVSLFPPGLEEKEEVSYTAESRLLVSSAENPYIRAQKTTFVEQPNRADESTEGTGSEDGSTEEPSADGASAQTIPFVSAPDINTLVRTANLYPFIIESDSVADYRRREFGELPGSVTALGITSVVTANRVELSEIPVIKLIAVAGSGDDAVGLADKTAKAFIGWLQEQQNQARPRILPEDRIVVQQLTVPRSAVASTGPSTTLPVLVFLVVFAAFCVLAILLDRLLPARPRDRSDVELESVKVKKTA